MERDKRAEGSKTGHKLVIITTLLFLRGQQQAVGVWWLKIIFAPLIALTW